MTGSDREESKQPAAAAASEAAEAQEAEGTVDVDHISAGRSDDEDTKEDDEHEDFVNEGFRQWEESRASWLGSDGSNSTARAAVPIDVDEIIDLIFSQRWRNEDDDKTLFPQPVPLPQMVDILVDLWEAEGLDI